MLFLFVFGIITCVFILKQLFASGSVITGEYSPIITEPEANNCLIVEMRIAEKIAHSLIEFGYGGRM